jgi:hypothetical protein
MLGKRHKSGAQKIKEKKHDLQLREPQKGALHRFFPTSRNAEVSQNQGQQHDQPIITQADGNDGGTNEQILEARDDANDGGADKHILDARDDVNDGATGEEEENLDTQVDATEEILGLGENLQPSDNAENTYIDEQSRLSIFDPRIWENLDNVKRGILIEKDPVREMDLEFLNDASNSIFHMFTIPESCLIERLLIGSGWFTLNSGQGLLFLLQTIQIKSVQCCVGK